MRTRVKFCGMTCAEDALAAAQLGADAVGFIFYPAAAAAVDAAAAAAIARQLPPFVDVVALFVNAAADDVRHTISIVRPQLLQFHGDENAAYCRQFGLPYLRACRVRNSDDIAAVADAHSGCDGLLLDAYDENKRGGSGKTFDWKLIPTASTLPLIIAGGLTATTVADLICAAHPWGVDVSSGISENGNRRRKNYDKMRTFIHAVQDADASLR